MAPAQIKETGMVVEGTVTNTEGDFFEQIVSNKKRSGFFVHKTGPDYQGNRKVLVHQVIVPEQVPWRGLDGKVYNPIAPISKKKTQDLFASQN